MPQSEMATKDNSIPLRKNTFSSSVADWTEEDLDNGMLLISYYPDGEMGLEILDARADEKDLHDTLGGAVFDAKGTMTYVGFMDSYGGRIKFDKVNDLGPTPAPHQTHFPLLAKQMLVQNAEKMHALISSAQTKGNVHIKGKQNDSQPSPEQLAETTKIALEETMMHPKALLAFNASSLLSKQSQQVANAPAFKNQNKL